MCTQPWEGKQLDKDILGDGKIYSPATCCFVEGWLNTLCTTNPNSGKWPVGVAYIKKTGRFQAYMRVYGRNKSLGCFSTSEEAHKRYCSEKYAHVYNLMKTYPNKIIKHAVLDRFSVSG